MQQRSTSSATVEICVSFVAHVKVWQFESTIHKLLYVLMFILTTFLNNKRLLLAMKPNSVPSLSLAKKIIEVDLHVPEIYNEVWTFPKCVVPRARVPHTHGIFWPPIGTPVPLGALIGKDTTKDMRFQTGVWTRPTTLSFDRRSTKLSSAYGSAYEPGAYPIFVA